MDDQQKDDAQKPADPFAADGQQVNDPNAVPPVTEDASQPQGETDSSGNENSAPDAAQSSSQETDTAVSGATSADSSTSAEAGKPDAESSTSQEQSKSDSAPATSDESLNEKIVDAVQGNVQAGPEVEKVDEIDQSPATASQPTGATIVATGDAEQPAKVVAQDQPATIPDPDPQAPEGATIPNPNVGSSQNSEIPSTLNPEATNSPAPITPAERVAHIEIQQNTAPGESVSLTQLSGDYTHGTEPGTVNTAGATHESILTRMMRDLEGVAAMGKSEIIAVLAMARARYDELTSQEKGE